VLSFKWICCNVTCLDTRLTWERGFEFHQEQCHDTTIPYQVPKVLTKKSIILKKTLLCINKRLSGHCTLLRTVLSVTSICCFTTSFDKLFQSLKGPCHISNTCAASQLTYIRLSLFLRKKAIPSSAYVMQRFSYSNNATWHWVTLGKAIIYHYSWIYSNRTTC
jgi:hypothetical protein